MTFVDWLVRIFTLGILRAFVCVLCQVRAWLTQGQAESCGWICGKDGWCCPDCSSGGRLAKGG